MTLRRADVLSVCRDLRAGTWEAVVDACFERWPERCALAGFPQYADSNRVYPYLVKLIASGKLVHDGPHRWALPAAERAAGAATRLSAVLVAHAQRLAADMIREREALRSQSCVWCGKPATTRDEDDSPSCRIHASERDTWAAMDAQRTREIFDVMEQDSQRR